MTLRYFTMHILLHLALRTLFIVAVGYLILALQAQRGDVLR
jgi:hypothetical protein